MMIRVRAILGMFLVIISLVPQKVKGQEMLGEETTSMSLEACISYAMSHSPNVKLSLLDESIGEREIKSQQAGWYPQASLQYSGTRNIKLQTQPIGGELITFGQNYNSNLQLQVNQTLFNRDQVFAGKTASHIRRQWNQSTQQAKINTTVGVSKAYYDILLTYQQLHILEENLVRQQKQYEDAKSRFESGLVDKTDYQRAAITLSNIKSDQKRAEEGVKAKMAYLKQLMGFPTDQNLKLNFDFEEMEQEAFMDTTQLLIPENRVELKLLNTEKSLSQLNTAYEKWAFLPNISAFYNYNWLYFNGEFSNLYQQAYPTSAVGITLGLPIFQGGKRVQKIRMAKLQEEKVNVGISNVKKRINAEYQAALANYKSDLYEWQTVKDNVELAREVYDVIKLQYDEGIKAYVDLIIAETELRTAQLNHYNALYNVLSSKLDLEKALGNINI